MYPDSSLTFEELIIRVSEALGIASYTNPDDPTNESDNRARVPTDPHRLDLCKRAINDAISTLAAAPHRWNCLNRTVTFITSTDGTGPLDIAGDPSRVRLPLGVTGSPAGEWTFSSASSGRGTIRDTSEDAVRMRHLTSSAGQTTGAPCLIAVRPFWDGQTGDGGNGWEAYLWPRPDAAYTISARFRLTPVRLVNLGDRHVFGGVHDQRLIDLAIAIHWIRKDPMNSAGYMEQKTRLVAEAIAQDNLHGPKTLGATPDRDELRDFGRQFEDAIYINGVRAF